MSNAYGEEKRSSMIKLINLLKYFKEWFNDQEDEFQFYSAAGVVAFFIWCVMWFINSPPLIVMLTLAPVMAYLVAMVVVVIVAGIYIIFEKVRDWLKVQIRHGALNSKKLKEIMHGEKEYDS